VIKIKTFFNWLKRYDDIHDLSKLTDKEKIKLVDSFSNHKKIEGHKNRFLSSGSDLNILCRGFSELHQRSSYKDQVAKAVEVINKAEEYIKEWECYQKSK
jgi:hypothetical protein